MKLKFLLLFIFCFTANLFASFEFNDVGDTISFNFLIDTVGIINQGEYSYINIEGLNPLRMPGHPMVPGVLKRIKEFENYSIKISYDDSIVYDSIYLQPIEEPRKITSDNSDGPLIIKENDSIYSLAQYPLNWPLWNTKTISFRQKKYSYCFVTPIKYNPVSKKVIIYKKMNVKLIKQTPLKPCGFISTKKRFLLLSVDKYKNAADSLILWKKLTGFETKIVIKNYWQTSQVQTEVNKFYNENKSSDNYVVLLGDIEDIASNVSHDYKNNSFVTDNPYFCMDGSDDYVPDIYYGRISVSSLQEALSVIKKIIDYERSPTTNNTFYKQCIGASYYSDGDDKDNNGNIIQNDGYADRRFVQTIEEINQHLNNLGYNAKRVYSTKNDVYPMYWNKTYYSYGNPVPDYLKKPNFAWDGDYKDIIKYLNEGSFILYHYDHGFEGGFAHPVFLSSDIDQIHSGKDLTLVLSIDCLTGKFDEKICFAEKFLRHDDGGAIAVIAPTALSYSGYNDALLAGMIDDIWPKYTIQFPNHSTVDYVEHNPENIIGKMFLNGLFSMEESWGTYYSDYMYKIYHIFGDPSTKLFTEYPNEIFIADVDVGDLDTNMKIENLDLIDGSAVLCDLNNDTVVDSKNFSGKTTVNLDFLEGFNKGDSLLLVISGVNVFPIMKKIIVKKGETNSSILAKNDILRDEVVSIGPNPFFKTIKVISKYNDLKIKIYSRSGGDAIVEKRLVKGLNVIKNIKSGIYTCFVYDKNERIVKKAIITGVKNKN